MYLAQEFGGGASLRAPLSVRSRQRRSFHWVPQAVDLADDIGSARWWRGAITLLALLGGAYQLRPRLLPLPIAGAAPPAERWLTIGPAAIGSRTGRPMVATDAVQPLTDMVERPTLSLDVMLGDGETLASALVRAGVAAGEAEQVAAAVLQSAGDSPASATNLAVELGARANRWSPRPLQRLRFRARFDLALELVRVGAGFAVKPVALALDRAPLRVSGRVSDGIFVSATNAGAPAEAVQTYLRTVAARLPIDGVDPSARYELVVERARTSDGQVRFGKLLYAGLEQPSGSIRMIEWAIGGRVGWYDEGGVMRGGTTGFAMPVDGRETSGFGMRFHPILGYSRMHQGVDYGAAWGSPVRAAAAGVVSFTGWHGGHGNMIKLGHGAGLGTGYGHLSRIAVAPGQQVAQGQVIGFVGSTGLSTGPHLHFEVYRNGSPVDPRGAVVNAAPLLSGAALQAFRDRLAAVRALR